MAKDNSQGTGVQYKVLLKPTDVGLLVMRRMERPHLDKSAELRRLIELGYAAEQAGFILDGTVLRHGGRRWDVQPNLHEDPAGQSPARPAGFAGRDGIPSTSASASNVAGRPGPGPVTAGNQSAVLDAQADEAQTEDSALKTNLRRLSV